LSSGESFIMVKNKDLATDSEVLKTLFDSIADGIFTIDRNFHITSFNRGAEKATGYSASKVLGKRCSEILKTNLCGSDCALKKAVQNGEPCMRYPVLITCAGGNQVPVSLTASPLIAGDGSVIGGTGTFRTFALLEELHHKVQGVGSFQNIISRSRKMKEIFSLLPKIAESDSTVLIEGESGTGKDLVARAIHARSQRKDGPMVAVNCGAIPDTLLESELFGYTAGAFTDAKKDKPGRFSQAHNGTIFLDEIGDVSQALQVKLLRVLQEKTFQPLGSTRTVTTNVRVVAATNKNLSEEVEKGFFRRDLYYRINVVKIFLPPLRERKEDILPLAESFIDRMNSIRKKNILRLAPKAIEAFMDHDWPGNIRELENVIEHAFVLCEEGLILCQHLPDSIFCREHPAEAVDSNGETLEEMEARAIRDALIRNRWNHSAAARELGIDKSTIWRKIRKLHIHPPPAQD